MIDEALLADARMSLLAAVPEVDPTRIVVVGGAQSRRRSELVHLGVRDEEPTRRWVLKVPRPMSRQHDLSPPLDTCAQVSALRRMDAHFRSAGLAARVPQVVAVLPDRRGFVMEYADGSSLAALLRLRALLDDVAVLHGCREAALVLRTLHALDGTDAPASPGRVVLLHGDFAPENILLGAHGTWCLDPDLVERGWAEQDVVRFLVMLYDAPLFVVLTDVPAARRLRRRAAAAFLDTYYEGGPWDPSLASLLAAALADRWATRDGDVVARGASLRWLRRWLLRRHFSRLIDEA